MAKKERHTRPPNKWESYTFGKDPIALEPFDLHPVTDIPIRLAVEKGVVKRHRDLGLYKLKEDWQGHPAGSIVVAGAFEEGKTFAIWTGDGHFSKPKTKSDGQEPSMSSSPPQTKPTSIPVPSQYFSTSTETILTPKIHLTSKSLKFHRDKIKFPQNKKRLKVNKNISSLRGLTSK